jgi:hypothetical protein
MDAISWAKLVYCLFAAMVLYVSSWARLWRQQLGRVDSKQWAAQVAAATHAAVEQQAKQIAHRVWHGNWHSGHSALLCAIALASLKAFLLWVTCLVAALTDDASSDLCSSCITALQGCWGKVWGVALLSSDQALTVL